MTLCERAPGTPDCTQRIADRDSSSLVNDWSWMSNDADGSGVVEVKTGGPQAQGATKGKILAVGEKSLALRSALVSAKWATPSRPRPVSYRVVAASWCRIKS